MQRSIIACVWVLFALTQLPTLILAEASDLIPYRTTSGKWGYCDKEKRITIQPRYDEAEFFRSAGCAWVKKGKKWGMIDSTGKEIIAPKYDWIENRYYGTKVNIGGKKSLQTMIGGDFIEGGVWGFVDNSGRQRLPMRFAAIELEEFPLKAGKPCFVVNIGGKAVSKTSVSGGKYGINTFEGKEIVPPRYDGIEYFFHGTALVNIGGSKNMTDRHTIGGRWGVVDSSGKEIVPTKYEEINGHISDNVFVKLHSKWGMFEKQSRKMLFVPRYDKVERHLWDAGMAVQMNGKWGFTDSVGRERIPCRFDSVMSIDADGYVAVQVGNMWGIIDKNGVEIVSPCYNKLNWGDDEWSRFNTNPPGYISVDINGKQGFIDSLGRKITPLRYDGVKSFAFGYAPVKIGDKWGFIDSLGKEITTPRYDEVKPFEGSYAAVKTDSVWGFIDRSGKEIAPPRYKEVEAFEDGFAAVNLADAWGMIDSTGKEIVPTRYDGVFRRKGYSLVKTGEMEGVIDRLGKEIIPPRYHSLGGFSSEGYAEAEAGKTFGERYKLGYVGKDGTEYWEGGFTAPKNK
ncbi:MAG: WG repeat-containing protein [Candidatus Kapaibacteriota bacterium]